MSFKGRFSSVLFWGIISAAFIGPGTVTTAASAGAGFQEQLLWALTFATISTIILQEACARITIASGLTLGEAIAKKYSGTHSWVAKIFLVSAILVGGAAYQAGNILGAVSGLLLNFNINIKWLVVLLVAAAGTLLWTGNTRLIANTLGTVVSLVGIMFLIVAFSVEIPLPRIFSSAIIPSMPAGSELLVIGLIGTTIVPYNFFLASGISQGQQMGEMRFGLVIAILIGGVISMAILLAGTKASGAFSFEQLALTLEQQLGRWAGIFFGLGLFAAGFTSSITAPFAAALTVQSVYGARSPTWSNSSANFKMVWGGILLVGLILGMLDLQPIPVIILAQALNGMILPFIVIYILIILNDPSILPPQYRNGKFANFFMLSITGLTTFLGLNNIYKAVDRSIPGMIPGESMTLILGLSSLIITFAIAIVLYRNIYRKR